MSRIKNITLSMSVLSQNKISEETKDTTLTASIVGAQGRIKIRSFITLRFETFITCPCIPRVSLQQHKVMLELLTRAMTQENQKRGMDMDKDLPWFKTIQEIIARLLEVALYSETALHTFTTSNMLVFIQI